MITRRPLSGGATAGPLLPGSGVSRPLALFMAAACGLIVANNYYAQPLMPELRTDLHATSGLVGLCVTLNQLGYALGLVLIVPLGDLLARRPLMTAMLGLDAVALAFAAAAPGAWTLVALLAVAGVLGTVINILIPLATTLAREDQRGQVVGTLMTGLLLGILLARTVAGALDKLESWRLVYGVAAVLMALLAVAMRVALPALPPSHGSSYPRLLASVGSLIAAEPFLRRRMATGALGFAVFQLLWTALPLMLSDAPYHYSPAVIGLFGLLGAAGAACARPAGRLQDRGVAHLATGLLIGVIGLAWVLLSGRTELLLIVAGILVLDVGVQGVHVLNQARIYAYPPQIRSRITTAYVTAYFLGGSAGGALAVLLYPRWGWAGVVAAGGVLTAAALALWVTDRTSLPVPPTAPAPAGTAPGVPQPAVPDQAP